MSDFVVGGKTIKETAKGEVFTLEDIELQNRQEEQLMQEVKEVKMELTEEQKQAIDQVKNAIDFTDSDLVISYAQDEMKALKTVSNRTLKHIRATDIGELGNSLTELAAQLSLTDLDEKQGFFSKLFTKAKNRAQLLQIKYESSAQNVERIIGVLEQNQLTLINDNKNIADMQEANLSNYQRLTVYLQAGREKLEEVRATVLPELEAKAQTGDVVEANRLNVMKDNIHLFEQQLHDIDAQVSLTQLVAVQLQTIANSNRATVQRIKRTKNVAIPTWDIYMSAAFYNNNIIKAQESDKVVSDMTNDLLVKATEQFGKTAEMSAQRNEEAVITIETLETMTKGVISSLRAIDEAQAKGREYREKATLRIGELRSELKDELVNTIENNSSGGGAHAQV